MIYYGIWPWAVAVRALLRDNIFRLQLVPPDCSICGHYSCCYAIDPARAGLLHVESMEMGVRFGICCAGNAKLSSLLLDW